MLSYMQCPWIYDVIPTDPTYFTYVSWILSKKHYEKTKRYYKHD